MKKYQPSKVHFFFFTTDSLGIRQHNIVFAKSKTKVYSKLSHKFFFLF